MEMEHEFTLDCKNKAQGVACSFHVTEQDRNCSVDALQAKLFCHPELSLLSPWISLFISSGSQSCNRTEMFKLSRNNRGRIWGGLALKHSCRTCAGIWTVITLANCLLFLPSVLPLSKYDTIIQMWIIRTHKTCSRSLLLFHREWVNERKM